MRIKDVEELSGIPVKNIRFYEECGLLTPGRAGNGYREYSSEDVETLKRIRILRSIGVSVEQIGMILRKEKGLKASLKEQKESIDKNIDNLSRTSVLTQMMIDSLTETDSIDTDMWLERIGNMKKEGIDFVNFRKADVHVKKKAGAVTGGIVMILLMAGVIAACLWGNSTDPMPTWLLVLVIAIPAAVIIGLVAVVIKRLKEIDKGEEDEAAKY